MYYSIIIISVLPLFVLFQYFSKIKREEIYLLVRTNFIIVYSNQPYKTLKKGLYFSTPLMYNFLFLRNSLSNPSFQKKYSFNFTYFNKEIESVWLSVTITEKKKIVSRKFQCWRTVQSDCAKNTFIKLLSIITFIYFLKYRRKTEFL